MNFHTKIIDFRAALLRRFGGSFAVLGKVVASLGGRRHRRAAALGGLRAQAPCVAVNAESETLQPPSTGTGESAFSGLAPGIADSAAPARSAPEPAAAIAADPVAAPVSVEAPAVPPQVAAIAPEPPPAASVSPDVDTARPRDCPAPAVDPELEVLRGRIASIETRVVDLETRKAEMEQLLDEYAFCQYQALGELLGEQLRLQHEVLRRRAERSSTTADRQAAADAAEEYAAYQRAHDEPAARHPELADGEREELKALYRAAAMRCHPDRVDESEKARAHELFLRTQDAYRRRDLETMRLISRLLATGNLPSPATDPSTPRQRLEALYESLADKGVELSLAIESIQMQAQYRRARHREQWDDHFAAVRERLEEECAALQRKLSRYPVWA